MSVPLETGIRNWNPAETGNPDPTCSGDTEATPEGGPGVARAARARDHTAQVIAFPGLARQRFGKPVAREADDPQPVRFRSPFTEDHPSMRCVLRDYREGAQHFCAGTPILYVIYWPIVAVPLLVRLFAAALAVMTDRPSYFWAVTLIGLLIAFFAH